MISIPSSVRIYLSTEPTDMRKGVYTLSSLVEKVGLDVYSGHLFVFLSRKRDKAKILFWDNGGFVLYYKSLEKGTFKRPLQKENEKTVLLESDQLSMLLAGVDISRIHRPNRWRPKKT